MAGLFNILKKQARRRSSQIMISSTIAVAAAVVVSADPISIGIGYSGSATDMVTAGKNAAHMAIQNLNGKQCKLLFVYDGTETNPAGIGNGSLKGVLSVISDSSIVYGATLQQTLTSQSQANKVTVLAWAGDISYTAVKGPYKNDVADSARQNGINLGNELKKAPIPSGKNSLIFSWGPSNHANKSDVPFTLGVRSVLGDTVKMIGGGATTIVYKGVPYSRGDSNMSLGLRIVGLFTTSFALLTNGGDKDAGPAARQVAGSNKDKISLAYIFNCTSRIGIGQKEIDSLGTGLGRNVPIFGSYGHGEIGKRNDTAAVVGTAYSIAICALIFNGATKALPMRNSRTVSFPLKHVSYKCTRSYADVNEQRSTSLNGESIAHPHSATILIKK